MVEPANNISPANTSTTIAQNTDPGAIAQALIDGNRRGTGIDVSGLKRDLATLTARDPALGAQVQTAVEARLTPVERGQLASATFALTAPDGQGITISDNAMPWGEKFQQPNGSPERNTYDRFDRLFGDGNLATNDTPAIARGIGDMIANNLTLADVEAARALGPANDNGTDVGRLALDLTQVGLDIVGIFEPTPFADASNAVISLGRGIYDGISNGSWADFGWGAADAAISVAGVLPYAGDTAKLLRLGKHADTVARTIEAVASNPTMRRAVEPALRSISDAIGRMPDSVLRSLPDDAQASIRRMKGQLDEFFGTGARQADEVVDAGTFRATVRGQEIVLTGVDNLPVNYVRRDRTEYLDLRRAFDGGIRADFARSLASDPSRVAQLRRAGLDDQAIERLASGRIPQGWQVHHKLPLDDGGTNAFDNLVLIRNDPYHIALTNAQRELTRGLEVGGARQVDFPVPRGFVYPPTP